MGMKTPLHAKHLEVGARMVDFGGWDMPLRYGSQIEEHHAVRRHAGIFDVSHMTVVDLDGERSLAFLERLLANDPAKLAEPGKALYSCMLNEAGGVVDDLIVYLLAPPNRYRLVVNAATRDKDLEWIAGHAAPFAVAADERTDLAMIAVQGPEARALVASVIGADGDAALALKRFSALQAGCLFVARTGYTGEDGFEILLPAEDAAGLWRALIDAGATPCGLAARDTLRLEAGLHLYGADMDETTSPLESGLGWTVELDPEDRTFIGRDALVGRSKAGNLKRFSGLLLEGRGVLRNHQRVVVEGLPDGEITSGGFSPTMERSIALARLPAGDYDRAKVEVRGKLLDVRVVDPPFVRNGQIRVGL